jgi:hypothetical protein
MLDVCQGWKMDFILALGVHSHGVHKFRREQISPSVIRQLLMFAAGL